MGSLRRRRLITLFCLAGSPVSAAGVCDTARPEWDGQPMTGWGEMIVLLSAPPALALLILTAIALRMRNQWMGLAVVVFWTILATLMTSQSGEVPRASAMIEGCIGSPTLFFAAVTAICAGTILYTAPSLGRRRDNGEK